MRIRFLIQARLQSERLPEKVLAPLGHSNVLFTLVDRLKKVCQPHCDIKLAIANEAEHKLIEFAENNGINYFTGDSTNVLSRFIESSADLAETDYVFRFTADNPFIDLQGVESLLTHLKRNSPDFAYVSGYPLGMAFEAIRVNALRSQLFYKLLPHHTEHVTTFIKERPELYTIEELQSGPLYEGIPVRLTIDEQADLNLAQKIFQHFDKIRQPYFGASEILLFYKNHPEVFLENAAVIQKSPQAYQVAS